MKKLSGVLLLAASALTMANAVAAPKNFTAKNAAPLVINYLGATGCPDADTVESDSFARFTDRALKISGYVAIVTADQTCAGGTGTIGSTLVFLRTDGGRAEEETRFVRVDAEISEPMWSHRGTPDRCARILREVQDAGCRRDWLVGRHGHAASRRRRYAVARHVPVDCGRMHRTAMEPAVMARMGRLARSRVDQSRDFDGALQPVWLHVGAGRRHVHGNLLVSFVPPPSLYRRGAGRARRRAGGDRGVGDCEPVVRLTAR